MAEEQKVAEPTELEQVQGKHLRALAEIDNMQKRMTKQIEEARDQGESYVAAAFLPIVDDIKRAMKEMEKPDAKREDLMDGLQFIFRKFRSVLEQLNVEGFESEGEKFCYALMEAIAEVPTHDALPGTVVGEAEQGYKRHGKLLRAAKVAVAVAPKEDTDG